MRETHSLSNEGTRLSDKNTSEDVSGRVRPFVRYVGYIMMALVSFSVCEVLAYAYLRTFEGYDGVHLMNYEFDDYKNVRPTPNYVNTRGVYHNAQGFRHRGDVSKDKSPGTYRVFIMGGSTGYGLQSLSAAAQKQFPVITNEETIDHYLQLYLNREVSGGRVEVINAAITSQQSHHHLIYLNQTVLKYRPDMVIFIDGFNDYYTYWKNFDQFRDYAYQQRAQTFLLEPTMNAWAEYTGWWLFRKSHFIHVAARTLRPIGVKIMSIGGERFRIDVEEALWNLQENADNNFVKMVERNALILRNENITPIFTLQPEIVLRQSKPFTDLEKEIFKEMDTVWEINYVEYKNKARPIVVEKLAKATAKAGALFLDLTDIYGGMQETAYTDYCHLTPEGNKWLAEYLGAKLLPIIKEKLQAARS